MEDLTNKTAEQISLILDEAEKTSKTYQEQLKIVEEEDLILSKEITQKQLMRKELQLSILKVKYNIKQIQSDIKIYTRAYWRARL